MDIDERIMSLLLVSQEQQDSSKYSLVELNQAIDNLKRQETHLKSSISSLSDGVSNAVFEVASALNSAVPVFKESIKDSHEKHAKATLSLIKDASTNELNESLHKVILSLEKAASHVDSAGERFEQKCQKITFTLLAKNLFGMVALLGIGYTMVLWEKREFTNEAAYVNAMRSEIFKLETNIHILEKKGGRIQLRECGPEKRICVEVDPATKQEYKTSVIPKGY